MPSRYAIYYAPEVDDPLWRLGSAVLGFDAQTGSVSEPPACLQAISEWSSWTEEPRRYGFHATLKAPFSLADGFVESDLLNAVVAFTAQREPFVLEELRVSVLNNFVALVPGSNTARIHMLADDCVRGFERLRASLSSADRARRLRSPLSEQQREALDRWGYPHVFADYRFHMTLTGPLPEARRVDIVAMLHGLLQPCLGPRRIGSIAVFRQIEATDRFRVLARFPFGAPAQP